jgi:hypothetical protein
MIARRMPFRWLYPLVDQCLVRMVRARVVLEDPYQEMLAARDMYDTLRVSGWTEEEFDAELLRYIDRNWDPPPGGGGGTVMPLPLKKHQPMRMAA